MAETVRAAVERQQLEALWDVELRRMGRDVVLAKLGGIPADPGTTFPLHDLPDGGRSPKRRDVEKWLGRMAAEEKATEARRFRYILVASVVAATAGVLAVAVGIIAAWPVIHDWIK
jgi:hypothetical protein